MSTHTPINSEYFEHVELDVPAVELALTLLCSKWTLPLIQILRAGRQRSAALRKSIPGISYRVLAERLREMERFGLVSRICIASKPPTVEYELTCAGRELKDLFAWLQSDDDEGQSEDCGSDGKSAACNTCPANKYGCPPAESNVVSMPVTNRESRQSS